MILQKEGPIGTGPYVVSSFHKKRAELKRNDNYWDGKAGFAKVEIPSINDANTRAMVTTGDVDMASIDLANIVSSKMIRTSPFTKWPPFA